MARGSSRARGPMVDEVALLLPARASAAAGHDGVLEGGLPADGVLSDEAVRIVQALNAKLQRARKLLRDAEAQADRVAASAEESATRCGSHLERQRQASSALEELQESRDRELERQRSLEEHLAASQAALGTARAYRARLVPGGEHAALQEELLLTLRRGEEAAAQSESLRNEIAKAEAKQCRREQRLLEKAKLEEERQRALRAVKDDRRSAARRISERAMQTQRDRFSAQQIERAAALRSRKEHLEIELQDCSRRNAEREGMLETLRARNKQLEAQERRQRAQAEHREAQMREELRGRAHQVRLLSSLFKGLDPAEEDEVLMPNSPAVSSTARSAVAWSNCSPSASPSTAATTSAAAAVPHAFVAGTAESADARSPSSTASLASPRCDSVTPGARGCISGNALAAFASARAAQQTGVPVAGAAAGRAESAARAAAAWRSFDAGVVASGIATNDGDGCQVRRSESRIHEVSISLGDDGEEEMTLGAADDYFGSCAFSDDYDFGGQNNVGTLSFLGELRRVAPAGLLERHGDCVYEGEPGPAESLAASGSSHCDLHEAKPLS
eukprot:TRINITY_DN16323_c0_g2_i1.p1 TRINITY_DN16323_c0_g2~~TRINITY_DN16323_c0_g2_i1.p1  ORF type:complete len:561 (+),score=136.00 TRINITY_DN16323_c0_g2_i1:47-1729(+)